MYCVYFCDDIHLPEQVYLKLKDEISHHKKGWNLMAWKHGACCVLDAEAKIVL